MANRYGQQFSYTLEKQTWKVYAQISFAASGVPTLATASTTAGKKGVASIAQNGTGDYTITLQDAWVKLLAFQGSFEVSGTGLPAAPNIGIHTNGVTSNPGTIRFVTSTGGSATNPASGEVLRLQITLGNSTAY